MLFKAVNGKIEIIMAFKTGGVGMKKKIALLQGGFNVEIMKEVMHGVLERT